MLSIQTTRNYEHAFSETLVALMAKSVGELSVQLVLVPAPGFVHRRARALLKRRERGLQHADHRDPGELGIDSIVEAKELKGALELQHRTLYHFDLRVAGEDRAVGAQGRRPVLPAAFRERTHPPRDARPSQASTRGASPRRCRTRCPRCAPGVLSTSELATVWQLPRGRVKHGGLLRSSVRRASAPGGNRPRRRARTHAGRARPGLDRRRATASTATRSSVARAAARAR